MLDVDSQCRIRIRCNAGDVGRPFWTVEAYLKWGYIVSLPKSDLESSAYVYLFAVNMAVIPLRLHINLVFPCPSTQEMRFSRTERKAKPANPAACDIKARIWRVNVHLTQGERCGGGALKLRPRECRS